MRRHSNLGISGTEMNIPPEVVDLRQLEAAEAQYMQAVRDHLASLTPWWAR